MNPPELKYSEEHEWVRIESDSSVYVGISLTMTTLVGPDFHLQVSQSDR